MFRHYAFAMLVASTIAAPAFAQGRPDARSMSCEQVQSLILSNGAVVLTTGQHTYDRYVANRSFCNREETPVMESLSTTDTNRCRVYRCEFDPRDGPVFRDR